MYMIVGTDSQSHSISARLIFHSKVSLTDVVQIHPSDFHKPSARAIEDWINAKYADKVIHKTGLCLGFHSLISTSEGLIGHGTGIVNVNVDFKLIVFRPRRGEIIAGVIANSDPAAGVNLDMDFFEDVLVPPQLLFEGTKWEKDDEGLENFVWTENENQFFFDRLEECLFRVEQEVWRDLSPQMQRPEGQLVDGGEDEDEVGARKTPYLIQGSMGFSGLGPMLWWDASQSEEGAGEDDAEGGATEGT